MIRLIDKGIFLTPEGKIIYPGEQWKREYAQHTMAYQVMKAHNQGKSMEKLQLKFDALVSPDNNYVSILQTASASGIKEFPVPYVLSNCHNTLCAVGGTINEDDHVFGLDNVKKYGGIFLPPYKAVLHQYMREMMAGCGKMILGSDSHTRYGVLGTLAIGEGGGEIVKQLLSQTYDIPRPPVIAVKLIGKPRPGVGPMDVALTLIGATFKNGFNKNKILEFVGEGISNLTVEYRMGIDVMTTESGALSSIWCTDEKVQDYLSLHGRGDQYREMKPKADAYYDGLIEIDLSKVECMMALPYHPSNVLSIHEFNKNPQKYLEEVEEAGQKIKGEDHPPFALMSKLQQGKVHVDQALVSGCSGGLFENIAAMADILKGTVLGGDASALGINPASQPIFSELARQGIMSELISAGATIRPCICGPCFGVTDVPADNQLSIRHVTRNYPNREGSKPGKGQMAAAILMDARSIAATVGNKGYITPASDLQIEYSHYEYHYDTNYYKGQVYDNFNKADRDVQVRKGPNIEDWPNFYPPNQHLILKVVGVYRDSVTTDDLSPSGDAVAYRSNPTKLATFTMRNKDTGYVPRSKAVLQQEISRREKQPIQDEKWKDILEKVCTNLGCSLEDMTIGSVLVGNQIGDGSSREQAASSQKILGGVANIAREFATKRYRSNLINWGLFPIILEDIEEIQEGEVLLIRNIPQIIEQAGQPIPIEILGKDKIVLGNMGEMTQDEKGILSSGCLINYNRMGV
ncbi:hydratase [Irregularibacter muris]|uniref:Hydratase n=1 Tax=Irregularibacter muris TaxID=1796619 RepID=A0AAE3KZT4_9FIRM|nr:hydratase [Irregularibacter muris]MCR1899131.1 hydratase [Irregularibacter muris]